MVKEVAEWEKRVEKLDGVEVRADIYLPKTIMDEIEILAERMETDIGVIVSMVATLGWQKVEEGKEVVGMMANFGSGYNN